VQESVRRITSARSAGVRFGAVCGMFIFFHRHLSASAQEFGGASRFTASIRDHAQRPRQIRGLPDALRTQVQAAARHGSGR